MCMQNLSSRFWKLEQFNPSSAWQQLMLQAIREAPDSFLVLNTPRGVHDTPRTINAKLSKNADQMSKRWHDWHDTTEYKKLAHFLDKTCFCISSELPDYVPTVNRFFRLISDRCFLFSNLSGFFQGPTLPALHNLAKNPTHYFYSHEYLIQKFNSAISQAPTELESKLQHTREELFTLSFPSYEVDAREYFTHWLQQQNIPDHIIEKIQSRFLIDYIKHQQSLAVLSHGEIFTENLDKTFDELKKNLISLYQSCVLRRRHLRRYSKDPLSNQIIEIKLNKREHIPQAAYYDVIHDLSQLFRAYTHSLRDQAYCKDLPESVNPYHLEILDQVYTRVSKLPSAIQPLVFWHLFTAATSKLAHGKLQSFRFMPKKYAPKKKKKSPDDFQYNRTKKILLDIQLFDYLLDVLPPDDREYAKFNFYVFTHFDRFPHFKTSSPKAPTKSPYTFNLSPAYDDCVDQLGGLIRYHIDHCIPHSVSWLNHELPANTSLTNRMDSLSTLLLYDASLLPIKRRLTNRVNNLLQSSAKDNNTLNYVDQYIQQKNSSTGFYSDDKVIEYVTNLQKDHNLYFEGQTQISQNLVVSSTDSAECARLVIQYYLQEQEVLLARKALYRLAAKLIPENLFEHGSPFSDS